MLATSALNSLDHAGAHPNEIELNNVYKLVAEFHVNPMFGVERSPINISAGEETLTIGIVGQSHTAEVRDAIRAALSSSFADGDDEMAIEKIKDVLRHLARPADYPDVDGAQVAQVRNFFGALQDGLK